MQNEKLLKVYMDMFRKFSREWARSSDKYKDRNLKRDFSTVMMQMHTFVKRYVGMQKYPEMNPKLEKYLIINNYVTKNARGGFDVSSARYREYRGD
ncbi:MAG: hypothetical protein IJA79_00710 [Desulfovibrio sp.]|nr:hypothetical protein [Desulfovibrio sp.]